MGLKSLMKKRRSKSHLEDWEIAIVKAMLQHTIYNKQTILAYFTRPNRTINHRLISQIEAGTDHEDITPSSKENMKKFIDNYPLIDLATGLHLYGDELIIKAREAMLNAVQAYNNPKTYFRAESFIVFAVIAWTYLVHAFFKSNNIDYRKRDKHGKVTMTKNRAELFFSLHECLNKSACTIDESTKNNLKYLVEIRNEIEHRCTQKIDAAISGKFQACCTNFNTYLKQYFGNKLGLDGDLSFALQFTHLSLDQEKQMAMATDLPENIAIAQYAFEKNLSDEQYNDPRYSIRYKLIQITANNKNKADQLVTVVPYGSKEAEQINQIMVKKVEQPKFKPKAVVEEMIEQGFSNFRMHEHTKLMKKFNPKHEHKILDEGGTFGIWIGNEWYYYRSWIDEIKKHCMDINVGKYARKKENRESKKL